MSTCISGWGEQVQRPWGGTKLPCLSSRREVTSVAGAEQGGLRGSRWQEEEEALLLEQEARGRRQRGCARSHARGDHCKAIGLPAGWEAMEDLSLSSYLTSFRY